MEEQYTYSQLSSQSVHHILISHYGLDESARIRFYARGMHDNYLVEYEAQKYILRVYRFQCRSEDDVLFELEWIKFLNENSDLAAEIITTKMGDLNFAIDSPEGARFAVLFRYADGEAPGIAINTHETMLLGAAVANIHKVSDAYTPQHVRQELDNQFLLDDSVSTIKPFLDADGFSYLHKLQEQVRISLPQLAKSPEIYGLCIGDVNPSNFHINENNKITIFDFDQCGSGYRAFEIAKFFSSIRNLSNKQEVTDAFLRGYQSIRPLTNIERESIPLFEIISVIWVMAIQVENVELIGYKYLEKAAWERRLADLKKLVSAWTEHMP